MLPTNTTSTTTNTITSVSSAPAPMGGAGAPIPAAREAIETSSALESSTLASSRISEPALPILAGVSVKRFDEVAFHRAASEGNIDAIKALISVKTLNVKELGVGIYHAKKNGHEAIVSVLLDSRPAVSQKALGLAIFYASKMGDEAVVMNFLENKLPLSEEDLGSAAIQAYDRNHKSIVRLFLTEGRTLSKEALGSLVGEASRKDDLDFLMFLLSDDRSISQKDLDAAIISAESNANELVIRFLLSHGRSISERALGQLLGYASQNGHDGIIRLVLSGDRSPSQRDFDEAVYIASRDGKEAVVRALIEGRTISEDYLRSAINIAARNGHEGILRALLEERAIFRGSLDSLILACAQEYDGMARFLIPLIMDMPFRAGDSDLYSFVCTEDIRSHYIIYASRQGWNDVLENLIQRGPIREDVRDSAFTQASNGMIRDMLMMAPILSEAEAAAAMAEAERSYLPSSVLLLSLLDLKQNPLKWLAHLVEEGLPSQVSFIEHRRAIDIGGISKQLISNLIEALILKEVFPRTEDGLPLIAKDEHRICVWQLGRLYSMLHAKNITRTDKLLTGILFHPRFFELVKIASSDEAEEIKLRDAATVLQEICPAYRYFTALILDPTDSNKSAYRAIRGCAEGEEEAGAKEELQDYLNPAQAFYEGCSLGFKRTLFETDAHELLSSIQGENLTAEKMITALKLDGDDAHLLEKFEWIKEEIRGADTEFLRKFWKTITGKTTMTPGLEIRIKETWRAGEVFEFHTCFNSMDIPRASMPKEVFLAALRACVTCEGYNIA